LTFPRPCLLWLFLPDSSSLDLGVNIMSKEQKSNKEKKKKPTLSKKEKKAAKKAKKKSRNGDIVHQSLHVRD